MGGGVSWRGKKFVSVKLEMLVGHSQKATSASQGEGELRREKGKGSKGGDCS